MSTQRGLDPAAAPDLTLDVRNTFGIDAAMTVPAFSQPNEYVPDLDTAYPPFDAAETVRGALDPFPTRHGGDHFFSHFPA